MSIVWQPFSERALLSLRDSHARINIWEGAVRSSKTISSMVRWIGYVRHDAPKSGILAMIGKTERTLKNNVIDPIIDIVGSKHARLNRGTGEFTLYGKPIALFSANDSSSEAKIRGSTMCGAYGDEITLWPENFFSMLLSRLSVSGAKFFGTTNPDGPSHWLKKNYLDRRHELDMRVFKFILDDNTSLDPNYVAALKKEYTGLWYRRFIKGEWCLADGAVWDMFDKARHVVDVNALHQLRSLKLGKPVTGFKYHVIGCDYGTSNPCVFLLIGYNNVKGPYFVVSEYYYDSRKSGRQLTDAQYADALFKFRGHLAPRIYVDPSAASFMVELTNRSLAPLPANNDVLAGVRFVGTQFSNGNLFIDKSCVRLIEEIEGYVWDSKASTRGIDAPVKVDDHACDALRYGIYTPFGGKPSGVIGGLAYH